MYVLCLLQCPPVAVAIAKQKMTGETFSTRSDVEFDVIEVSDSMGWDSGPVKRELKLLQWNLQPGQCYLVWSVELTARSVLLTVWSVLLSLVSGTYSPVSVTYSLVSVTYSLVSGTYSLVSVT